MLVLLNYDGQWIELPMCLVWAFLETKQDVLWDRISEGAIIYVGY